MLEECTQDHDRGGDVEGKESAEGGGASPCGGPNQKSSPDERISMSVERLELSTNGLKVHSSISTASRVFR